MRNHAFAAILNAPIGIAEVAAAFIAQGIKRTVAEQAIKILRMFRRMAREKLAILMVEKRVLAIFGKGMERVALFHLVASFMLPVFQIA